MILIFNNDTIVNIDGFSHITCVKDNTNYSHSSDMLHIFMKQKYIELDQRSLLVTQASLKPYLTIYCSKQKIDSSKVEKDFIHHSYMEYLYHHILHSLKLNMRTAHFDLRIFGNSYEPFI